MLRYVNSALGAACLLLLLGHLLWGAALLFGIIGYTPLIARLGWALLVCLILHALLSLYLVFIQDRPRPRFPHARANSGAWVQRLSGLALLLLLIPHVVRGYGHMTMSGFFLPDPPTVGRYLMESLLLLAVALHLEQSLSKLTLSLGLLRDERSLEGWRRGMRIGVAALTLWVWAALTSYFFFG